MRLTGLAPAKINLCLHVGPVRPDGYHPLASLVAFADVGDIVTVEPADRLSLEIVGPFAEGLGGDNLVLTALRALGAAVGIGEPPLRVTLDKRLPIASGLGGGSSDAGAALRLARRALDLDIEDPALEALSRIVGADGPMCLRARTAWAEGVGDVLTEEPRLPALHAVLVNPGVACSTGAVYRGYDAGPPAHADRPADPEAWTVAGVTEWLATLRNDLQQAALVVAPAVAEAIAELSACQDVRLVRMSGSGATVFGLFPDRDAADAAIGRLRGARQSWWVTPAVLGDTKATLQP